MQSMTIDSAAIRLTDTILGHDELDLEQALKAIAANIGLLHIAYVPLCSQKSEDANLLSAICTYPVAWQARYFKKQYARIDPVIARGSEAVLPFDWDELPKDDPAVRAFFEDAADHDVGRNGLSIPIRNRKGVRSLVSFTSNHSKDDWAEYKSRNIVKLQPMAVLINSAAAINFKLTSEPVELSKREEECLIWAARGKTYHDIAGILKFVVRQRQNVSGYGAPQIELHKLDARGRGRYRDWSHTSKSPETAMLIRGIAGWRFASSLSDLLFKLTVRAVRTQACAECRDLLKVRRWPNSSPAQIGDLKPVRLSCQWRHRDRLLTPKSWRAKQRKRRLSPLDRSRAMLARFMASDRAFAKARRIT